MPLLGAMQCTTGPCCCACRGKCLYTEQGALKLSAPLSESKHTCWPQVRSSHHQMPDSQEAPASLALPRFASAQSVAGKAQAHGRCNIASLWSQCKGQTTCGHAISACHLQLLLLSQGTCKAAVSPSAHGITAVRASMQALRSLPLFCGSARGVHWDRERLPPNLGHAHLGEAAAVDHARIRHRLAQHAQRVVQGALRLVQHVAA